MPVDVRFFLLANIDHFTAQLQSGCLDERQAAATRALLANTRLRWAYLEMQAAGNDQPFRAVTPPPPPIAPTMPAAIPPAERSLSALAEVLHPLFASLWRLPGSGPSGPGPSR
jgi:hypothetical protein